MKAASSAAFSTLDLISTPSSTVRTNSSRSSCSRAASCDSSGCRCYSAPFHAQTVSFARRDTVSQPFNLLVCGGVPGEWEGEHPYNDNQTPRAHQRLLLRLAAPSGAGGGLEHSRCVRRAF